MKYLLVGYGVVILVLLIGFAIASPLRENHPPVIKDIKVSINNIHIEPYQADGYITTLLYDQYNIYCPFIYCLNNCMIPIR